MNWYCCFWCPREDHTEKSLSDVCPTCNRHYGFPLDYPPEAIEDYRIIRPLGRGFYAATYLVEKRMIKIPSVLKVTPKKVLEVFRKDFEKECATHLNVSQGSEHIVDLLDMFDADVTFGNTSIDCHVAQLAYVEGKTLASYIAENSRPAAKTIVQIAVDLFKICDALYSKQVYHNDLHDENIVVETLPADSQRADAIDRSVRAVAIDLGSVADASKSDRERDRPGDLQRIARHLSALSDKLLRDPDVVSDFDYRVASGLSTTAQGITPPTENQRVSPMDSISQIEKEYYRVTRTPWREPLELRTFDASYNAQTMYPWHVPRLLVDPDEQWLSRICSPGPQVITGMRGCGKTMLLRALQFHARASQRRAETNDEILKRLREDNYVGLFVSAQRLLDRPEQDREQIQESGEQKSHEQIQESFARLFVAYGLEASRAMLHLADLDKGNVSERAYQELKKVIAIGLGISEEFPAKSIDELEQRLMEILISLSRGERSYTLKIGPEMAFTTMADALQRCSGIWERAQVLFLLDDVSTRYLNDEQITTLISALLFQNPTCAFKLTSEAQTIELGLKSPGRNRPARVGRDLNIFDLGAEVYKKIKAPGHGNGRYFVEKILEQRRQYFAGHPAIKPRTLLGDVSLEQIAWEVGRGSRERKQIYRGLGALAGMCVGDIGDVIILYERILRSASIRRRASIAADVQSECFQDFCVRRLYDLNRRGGYLKNVAKSFAEASHKLLVKSCSGVGAVKEKTRIRQYLSMYVRVTTGDVEHQMDKLRELIDAGVFVFAGGLPRTKTRDSDPMQQFKLTYRKIYGLADYIGLAERDRFELSGEDLEEWLHSPSKGILLRNLGAGDKLDKSDDLQRATVSEARTPMADDDIVDEGRQIMMFEGDAADSEDSDSGRDPSDALRRTYDSGLVIQESSSRDIAAAGIVTVIAGLGFESRTSASIDRLCAAINPTEALLIAYDEEGRRAEIETLVAKKVNSREIVTYKSVLDRGVPDVDGKVIVDVTGLAKPAIFHAIRNELRVKREVWVCHTEAEEYYPLEADLEHLLGGRPSHIGLEDLYGILTGEEGPYRQYGLLPHGVDETRQRVICAFASAKHERLLALLDGREYDRVEIFAPPSETYRSTVARIAASVAERNNANSEVMKKINESDVESIVKWLTAKHRWWYERGLNFELGLTGSKLQAVACAAASAILKVSQCWYVQPRKFDSERFTKGVGRTRFYRISLPVRP